MYSQKLLDHAKQSDTDTLKTTSKSMTEKQKNQLRINWK